jgi:hypothetical protein
VREVDDPVVGAIEADVDVLDRRIPEPLDVAVGSLEQLFERLDAVAVHEPLEAAALDDLGARLPDHIADDDGLHSLIVTSKR